MALTEEMVHSTFYRVIDEKLEGQPMLYNITRWNYVDAR